MSAKEVASGVARGAARLASAPGRAGLGFWRGFRYPLRGARFVYFQHPGLVRFWIFPILLTALFLGLVTWGAVAWHDDVLRWMWEEPTGEGWWVSVLGFVHGLLGFLVGVVLFLVGLVAVVALTSVVSAPFNDALSAEVERLLTGRDSEPFSFAGLLRDLVGTVGVELVKLTLYLTVMGPLLLLSLVIPVVGPILYSVFGFFFTAVYFAIDYVDWPAARRSKSLAYRVDVVRARPTAMIGFGTGVWLFLFLPLVNLLFMPAAVAGGTLLFLDLEGDTPNADPSVALPRRSPPG